MQNSRTWAAVIGLLIILLIVFALVQNSFRSQANTSPQDTSATSTATSTQSGITGTGDFSVTPVSKTVELNIPNFRAPLKFSPSIQSDVKTALQSAADTLVTRLSANSLDLKSWIDLGTVRKMAGDYAGAEEAWLFVTKASPDNAAAFNNLGDLYENFLKNYPKAEQMYLKAIAISPQDEQPYLDLYTMYANLYKKNTTAAEDILKKGVAANPDSVSLHVQLARYYKSKGDTADAKAQYDAAIAAAQKAGQSAVAQQIQDEENQ